MERQMMIGGHEHVVITRSDGWVCTAEAKSLLEDSGSAARFARRAEMTLTEVQKLAGQVLSGVAERRIREREVRLGQSLIPTFRDGDGLDSALGASVRPLAPTSRSPAPART